MFCYISKQFINTAINVLFFIYKHIYYKADLKSQLSFLTEKISKHDKRDSELRNIYFKMQKTETVKLYNLIVFIYFQ